MIIKGKINHQFFEFHTHSHQPLIGRDAEDLLVGYDVKVCPPWIMRLRAGSCQPLTLAKTERLKSNSGYKTSKVEI